MNSSKIINELVLTRLFPNHGRTQATGDICRSLSSAASALEALEEVMATRDPMVTDASHYSRVAKNAKRLEAKISATREGVQRITQWERDRLQKEIQGASRLDQPRDAAEIRQILRTMPIKDKIAKLQESLDQGDSNILAAVIDSPEMLHGIPKDVVARYREYHETKTCPNLKKDLEALDALVGEAETVFQMLDGAARTSYDPEFVRKAEAESQKALLADIKFDQAVSQPR